MEIIEECRTSALEVAGRQSDVCASVVMSDRAPGTVDQLSLAFSRWRTFAKDILRSTCVSTLVLFVCCIVLVGGDARNFIPSTSRKGFLRNSMGACTSRLRIIH